MTVADRTFKMVDEFLFGINELFGNSAFHHCKLSTSDDEYELTGYDGSLCTIVKVHGVLEYQSDEIFERRVEQLRKNVLTRFSKKGHLLQVVLDYNLGKYIESVVHETFRPSRITAKNMGFDIDDIFDDWGETLARYCAKEDIWFVLWTRPCVLSKQDEGRARRKMRTLARKTCPQVRGEVQQVGTIITEIRSQHASFVDTMVTSLKAIGVHARRLDCHTALRELRQVVDYEFTANEWRPWLPGDKLPLKFPEPGDRKNDLSCLMYPSIRSQVFPREAAEVTTRVVEVGDKLHSPMMVVVPPQYPTPFRELFTRLKEKRIPWRISFFIDAGGLSCMTMKSLLAQLLYFTSSVNKRFCRAIEGLKEAELHGESIVRLKIGISTYVNRSDPDAMDKLKLQAGELAGAVQAWGTCDIAETVGSPLLGFSGTLPGFMLDHPAPSCAAPLGDVLGLLPLDRPSSPWTDGSLIARTPDGKIMPFHPMSGLQASWIDLGSGKMGQGKSFQLNIINFAFLFQPGLSRLPYLSITDVGPSSRGLIDLLKAKLPEDQKHKCAYYRLRMTDDYAVNPCDTPVGCQRPIKSGETFLVNLLSLFATPLDKTDPQDGVPGIARACVEMAYDLYAQENNPKLYNPSIDPKLTELVEKLDLTIDSQTSWWEIVDAFFERGHIHAATLAQRHAVPLIADIASLARSDAIRGLYDFKTPNGEHITEFFWRSCIEAIQAYPIFAQPTVFDIGDCRVVSLDIKDVAPRGSSQANRQTAIILMLTRHIGGAKFYVEEEDADGMPERYRDYHLKIIKQIQQDPKRQCFDEVHRAFKNSSAVVKQFIEDIEASARESRKWNLSIGMYSQRLDDMPEILIELANNIFILGVGTVQTADYICGLLGLNDRVKEALLNVRKPDHSGSDMIQYSKTSKGTYIQLVTSTIGKKMVCAFNSTAEDRTVRNALYDHIGTERTLDIMTRKYPEGIKEEVERRRLKVKLSAYRENVDYLQQIIDELIVESRKEAA